MKTHRMSRSVKNRNAARKMAVRGRAGNSRAELLSPDIILSGRRFRRANGFSRTEAAEFGPIIIRGDAGFGRPSINSLMDPFTRAVLGFDIS